MSEGTKQRLALDLYWELGAERSIERLHALMQGGGRAPSLRTLYEWSRRYGWQSRIAELERQARVADDEARLRAIREMSERHARQAVHLQDAALGWLDELKKEHVTADAAVRALVEAVRMERLARGEPTERQEVSSVNVAFQARLSAVTDDELARLIEHVAGSMGRAGEARP